MAEGKGTRAEREPLIPSITLPKGGGALQSIGETFQANAVTGTGAVSVPVAASPGRGGFGPKLALAYDSGAGNGPFGLGWNIGVPSISRKTQRGLPRYQDELESDTFLLAGAEDLVPARRDDGSREIISDDLYTTIDGERHTVYRYRPRIEGLFARIERWVRTSDSDTHWRVITGDNVTTIYGATPASRIADGTRTFQWLIERSYDDKGNVLVYEYKPEDDAGIDASRPHELGRLRDRTAFAHRYVKRIRYGNSRPYLIHLADFPRTEWERDNRWFFELVFDYGDHDRTAADETSIWPVRQDPFSTYRAGFEVRTYRLCRRILMFHRFDEPQLVRSTELHYDNVDGNPIATQLLEVVHTSHEPGREARSPGVHFTYSSAEISTQLETIDREVVYQIPDGRRTHWLDFDGEGLTGILAQHDGAWFFQRNEGDGQFAAPVQVASVPSMAASGGEQLVDIDGDGRVDLVLWSPGLVGAHGRTSETPWQWKPFRAFERVPSVEWNDPQLRLVDLTGDGHPDVLITEDDCFCWYPSEGEAGYGGPQRVAKAIDEERGPRVLFADQTQSIFLADMSGDGLDAIVRIRNGEVCYWPNTGYGTFGAKVTMEAPPYFDDECGFDPRRIRLGDIDGSGTSDIFYVGDETLRYWRNQSGNSWSAERRIADLPRAHGLSSIQVLDLLGTGTSCVVWTSDLPGDHGVPVRYLPLMSQGKPYLLTEIDNGMGATTKVTYAPSTKFYLQDRRAGRPWITTLPFPVHVVERIETHDAISDNTFVSLFAYHHGFYDGVEREFRGFGMVEQRDTDEYSELGPDHVPPVLTRTWFHTGFYEEGASISRHYETEYYNGDSEAFLLNDTELPVGLTGDEQREACRALKGRTLRHEVYALDGSGAREHPYTVAESKAHIRVIQRRDGDKPAVFYVCDCESLSYHYEREPRDPRIAHAHTLEIDRYGTVRKSAAIAYPRRNAVLPEQQQMQITYVEADPIHLDTTLQTYRIGLPFEQRSYEVPGLANPGLWDKVELREAIAAADKRMLSRTRARYYRDTLDPEDPAPFEQADTLGIPHEQFALILTQDILDRPELGGRFTPELLREAGYRNDVDGDASHWWVPSGIKLFDRTLAPSMFYLPAGSRDPFGATSVVEYDEPRLLFPTRVVDPAGNEARAEYDYRVLAPRLLTDPNGNRSEVVFDTRGLVIASAVMGKEADAHGDRIAAFTRIDSGDLVSEAARIFDAPHRYLQGATTFFYYDLFAWRRDRKPSVALGLTREVHVPDERGTPTPIQISVSYSDGFGREILRKVQAEDGDAPHYDATGAVVIGPDGKPHPLHSTDRWVGNGATVFNNKGLPIRQYHPFFDSRPDFTDEAALVQIGVSPTVDYDPLGRVIRTNLPDGTFSRVELGPWHQTTYDPSDTVLDSDWHDERDPEDPTARKAALHHDTPTRAYLDTLGRPFVTVAHNKRREGRNPPFTIVDEFIPARVDLDIEGNPIALYDGRRCEHLTLEQSITHVGNTVMTYVRALGGLVLHQRSMDAGPRWLLANVAGNLTHVWDERSDHGDGRGHHTHLLYDRLQRPTHTRVDLPQPDGSTQTITAMRMVYGDELDDADARARNLRGKPYLVFDGAGCVKTERCDFKGNALETSRRLFDIRQLPGWPAVESLRPDWSSLDGAPPDTIDATPLLESQAFTSSSVYDALDRPTEVTGPDRSVHLAEFNKANLLESVRVRLRGADERRFVDDINYNARGQRTSILYGNGVTTTYTHDDRTFRLTQLTSTRDTRKLQDLFFTYDAIGNITELRDAAIAPIYFDNDLIEGAGDYVYDSLSRLVEATGRESAASAPLPSHSEITRGRQIPAHDQALRKYTQLYDYDPAGNILALRHAAGGSDWRRSFDYAPDSNRLQSNDAFDADGNPVPDPSGHVYAHDANGNLLSMRHLARLDWDYTDHLAHVRVAPNSDVLFAYDGKRQRVRKVHVTLTHITERIYLGGFEIYRHYLRDATTPHDELHTLHVMDGESRLCMVETPKREANVDLEPSPRFRFQLGNQLGSAITELDEDASPITHEEYHPYGTTAYHAQNGDTIRVSSKRYRYTGMERDEETGINYHAARYYAAWLSRWCTTDPIGLEGGANLFEYCHCSPIANRDASGLDPLFGDIPMLGDLFRARRPQPQQRAQPQARAPARQTRPRARDEDRGPAGLIPRGWVTERHLEMLRVAETSRDPVMRWTGFVGAALTMPLAGAEEGTRQILNMPSNAINFVANAGQAATARDERTRRAATSRMWASGEDFWAGANALVQLMMTGRGGNPSTSTARTPTRTAGVLTRAGAHIDDATPTADDILETVSDDAAHVADEILSEAGDDVGSGLSRTAAEIDSPGLLTPQQLARQFDPAANANAYRSMELQSLYEIVDDTGRVFKYGTTRYRGPDGMEWAGRYTSAEWAIYRVRTALAGRQGPLQLRFIGSPQNVRVIRGSERRLIVGYKYVNDRRPLLNNANH